MFYDLCDIRSWATVWIGCDPFLLKGLLDIFFLCGLILGHIA
jgi:hypothetical protein